MAVVPRVVPGQPKTLEQLVQEATEEARAANAAREKEIRDIYQQMLTTYAVGGPLEKAGLAQIERAGVSATTKQAQRDISRGLYGIRPYEQEWEATVGAGARLTLEQMLAQGRTGVLSGMAGFIEGIENEYPDYGSLTEAYAAQAGAGGGAGGITGRTTGTSPSNRPGWSISGTYGGVPTGQGSIVQGGLGGGPGIGGATATSGTTLSELYAQGRAEGTGAPTLTGEEAEKAAAAGIPGYWGTGGRAEGKFTPFSRKEYEKYLASTGAARSYTYK